MSKPISEQDENKLATLSSSLRRERPRGPARDGDEAFTQHLVLTTAVHRASRLDALGSESETDAWMRYMSTHFPVGRNDPDDARLLFGDWRTGLVKDGVPGLGVTVTHGQTGVHWTRDQRDRLCINLEDMWGEFALSVEHFIEYLRLTPGRRKIALRRFRERQFEVERIVVGGQATAVTAITTIGITNVVTITGSASSAVGPWRSRNG